MAWIGLIIHLRSPLQGVCVACIIMAALYNRARHYIFVLWFLLLCSIYLFLSCLISAVADWMSTILPRMVWP